MPKRKRVSSARAVRTSMRVGNWASLARASRRVRPRLGPLRGRLSLSYMNQRLSGLTRMIETKELQWKTAINVPLAHNNITIIQAPGNGLTFMNAFQSNIGAGDDMTNGAGSHIGDQISVRRVLFKAFIENQLARPKVHYRFMLIRCAKGDLPTRATLFKGNCGNKMIDQINTERFSVVYSKSFTNSVSNNGAGAANPGPVGQGEPVYTSGGGIATRIFTASIPGSKFARGGNVKFENGSTNQVKFFDYVPIFFAYDWGTTLQDVNNVGKINEMYVKTYFKDA